MLRFRESYLVLVLLVFCLVIFVRCSDDNPAAPDEEPSPDDSISKTIDQTGGRIALGDEAWVDIPSGALDSAVEITITRISNLPNPPANYVLRGAGYSFTPHQQAFNANVEIGVTYKTPPALSDPSIMKLDDDADTSWEAVVGAIFNEGTAICSTLTFSVMSSR